MVNTSSLSTTLMKVESLKTHSAFLWLDITMLVVCSAVFVKAFEDKLTQAVLGKLMHTVANCFHCAER